MREVNLKVYQIHELSEEARKIAIESITKNYYEEKAKHNIEVALETIDHIQFITGVTGEMKHYDYGWNTILIKTEYKDLPFYVDDLGYWQYAISKINEMSIDTWADKWFKKHINSYTPQPRYSYERNMANVYWTFLSEVDGIDLTLITTNEDIIKFAQDEKLEFFSTGKPYLI